MLLCIVTPQLSSAQSTLFFVPFLNTYYTSKTAIIDQLIYILKYIFVCYIVSETTMSSDGSSPASVC